MKAAIYVENRVNACSQAHASVGMVPGKFYRNAGVDIELQGFCEAPYGQKPGVLV
jgi:hypothetical protein